MTRRHSLFSFLAPYRPIAVLTATLLAAPFCAKAGDAPNRFRRDTVLLRIHRLQDARATPALLQFLQNANPAYRAEAASAFASVQAPAAREPLSKLLAADATPAVRQAAARALGLLADTLAQASLLTAAQREQDPAARAAALQSLGRVATVLGGGLRYLTEESLPADEVARTGWAWGLFRAAQRGVVNDEAVARAVALLRADQPPGVRLAAASLLARTPRLDLTQHGPHILTALRTDSVRDVRIALAGALGRIASPPAAAATLGLIRAAPDAHVRLAALRAASKLRYEQVKEAAWGALADPSPHVALTAAEYFLQNAPADEVAAMFRQRAARHAEPQVQAVLLATALKLAANQPDLAQGVFQDLTQRYQQAPSDTYKSFYLRALGQSPLALELLARETFAQPLRPIIATAGMETLVALRGRADFPASQQAAFVALLRQAIASGDVALVGTAAGALRDPALNFRSQLSDLGFLREARQRLQLPRDIETAQEVDQTLAFLESKPYVRPATTAPAGPPTDWARVLKMPVGQLVTVTTNRGVFTMELLVEQAPAAIATIARLIQEKFYDGKPFHRVVPNFVAQGGDPRGDGWGGLDYTLRSELADESFTTGAVGLASAGLNTESCQWFVMHCPAPHLDGRYTLFARIHSGQEVVDRLMVGDVIEKMRLK
jgi:cyclophilin family peptidyl-prolyl cis-trans isomerase/HEAT repeat protein